MKKENSIKDIKVSYKDVGKYYYKKAKLSGRRTPGIFVLRLVILGGVIYEPVLIKQLMDTLVSDVPDIDHIYRILSYMGGILALGWVSWRFIEWWIVKAQLIPMKAITDEAFAYIHQHSASFFANQMSGTLLKKVKSGKDGFENLYDKIVFSLITPIGMSIGAVIILGMENLVLGITMGIWVILFVGIQVYLYHKKGPKEMAAIKSHSIWSGYLADTFSNNSTIQQTGSLQHEKNRHEEYSQDRYKKDTTNRMFGNFIYAASGLLWSLMFIGGLVFMIQLRQKGMATVGTVVLFLVYLEILGKQLWPIGNVLKQLVKALEDGRDFLELMMLPHDIRDSKNAVFQSLERGDIDMKNISFHYPEQTTGTGLIDFSLSIASQQHVGLVGKSGAGKSTITKLLLRLFDIDKGSIVIGGHDIKEVLLESLRSQISYVPQEPILFHRTIKENIGYAKPDASDEEIIVAAKRAHAHDFILELSHGYDTKVGERGVKLSGGQRQRIAIARAILHDAPIIIMDEATSSLDSKTEHDIKEAMIEVMKNKTALIIAHRLSTVKNLDRLIVIDEGKIAQDGTHEELLKNDEGIYKELWNFQEG